MKMFRQLLLIGMVCVSFIASAQSTPKFDEVNLAKLRKVVMNQLLSDDLIRNKQATVYFFLREDGILLNGKELAGNHQATYQELISDYRLGVGPDRAIYISADCTAVGDFSNGSFHGKSEGKLRIVYDRKPWE